jgi:hypothetical protein
MRPISFALIVLCVIAVPKLAAQAPESTTVLISLIASNTGHPVGEASVRITSFTGDGREFMDRSDFRGRVLFENVPGGFYRVDVIPAGYAQESFTLAVPMGGEKHEAFRLSMAHELGPIEVTADRMHHLLVRRGFYNRQRSGFGRFFTHEEIMASGPTRTSDALARIPSLRVRDTGTGLMVHNLSATDSSLGEGICRFNIFIDGSSMTTPEGYFDGDMIPVDDLLGIEVYHRASHAPQMYRGPGCGTILIWTGRPDRG